MKAVLLFIIINDISIFMTNEKWIIILLLPSLEFIKKVIHYPNFIQTVAVCPFFYGFDLNWMCEFKWIGIFGSGTFPDGRTTDGHFTNTRWIHLRTKKTPSCLSKCLEVLHVHTLDRQEGFFGLQVYSSSVCKVSVRCPSVRKSPVLSYFE